MTSLTPLKTGNTRVFVVEGPPSADSDPVFQGCYHLGSVSRSFGGSEPIRCPDPNAYSQFIDVGETQEPDDPVESSITGRIPADSRFDLITYAEARTRLVVHVHTGTTTNPQNFGKFDTAWIFELARITDFDTDDLGALDEDTPVNGTANFTARYFYQVVTLNWSSRAADLTTEELVAAVVYPLPNPNRALNKQRVSFVAHNGDGTTTKPTVLFSFDDGANWTEYEVSTMAIADTIDAMAVLNENLVVIHAGGMEYAPLDDFILGTATFSSVSDAGAYNAAFSTGFTMYVAGDSGNIYYSTDPTAQLEALATGLVAQNLNAIHALDEYIWAVGASNSVVYSLDGASFSTVTGPNAGVDLTAVAVKGEDEVWVGCADGSVWYTTNRGNSWTERSFPGSGTGSINDIVFVTPSVGFIAHQTSTTKASLLKTTAAGATGTWVKVPAGGTFPAFDKINQIASQGDPNFVVCAGLADDGTNGYLLVGKD